MASQRRHRRFAIDVPVSPFLSTVAWQGTGIALGLFLALALAGLTISLMHFRQLEASAPSAGKMAIPMLSTFFCCLLVGTIKIGRAYNVATFIQKVNSIVQHSHGPQTRKPTS